MLEAMLDDSRWLRNFRSVFRIDTHSASWIILVDPDFLREIMPRNLKISLVSPCWLHVTNIFVFWQVNVKPVVCYQAHSEILQHNIIRYYISFLNYFLFSPFKIIFHTIFLKTRETFLILIEGGILIVVATLWHWLYLMCLGSIPWEAIRIFM